MSTIKVTNIQDTSGGNQSTSEEIFQGRAKAWVNFDGTSGTSPFTIANGGIRDSFNVNSVTDNGTGDYSVTFANAMSSANYVVTTSYMTTNASTNVCRVKNNTMATTGFDIQAGGFQQGATNVNKDHVAVMIAVFI